LTTSSSVESSYAFLALDAYNQLVQSTDSDLSMKVMSNDISLLDARIIGDSQTASSLWPFDDIAIKPTPMKFSLKGTGEVSLVVGMDFIPAELPTTSIYRGIFVQKFIQRVDPITNTPVGPYLTQASIGTQVVVTIQITSWKDLDSLSIVDPISAALQVLDDTIYDTTLDGCWWCIRSYFSSKLLNDKVIFYGQQIYAGTHTVSYVAVVVSSGNFSFPPTKVFDVLQPEVLGFSAGGFLLTKALPSVFNQFVYNTSNRCVPENHIIDEADSNSSSSVTEDANNAGNGPIVMKVIFGFVGALFVLCAISAVILFRRKRLYKRLKSEDTVYEMQEQ